MFILIFKNIYEQARMVIRKDEMLSDHIEIKQGLLQGDPTSLQLLDGKQNVPYVRR